MYDIIDIYQKEMNVDLHKINNYFESAVALYEATTDVYFDDNDMLYEASSTFKEKVKKTFTAIIEAIKAFFKKCRDAIHEKLVESRVKKAFADVTKYAKSEYKNMLNRDDISRKKYKHIMKKLNDLPKAYSKVYIMCEKITKDVMNTTDVNKAERYLEDGCDRMGAFVDSLGEELSNDIEQFISEPECFYFADTSDIAMLNKNMENMGNECGEHIKNLYRNSIKDLIDEITESVEEDDKKQSVTQKVTLIQKLANFVASLTKKINSIITSFTIKIMAGVVNIAGKLTDKVIEHETKKQAKKAES
jgi:hypothetical protein